VVPESTSWSSNRTAPLPFHTRSPSTAPALSSLTCWNFSTADVPSVRALKEGSETAKKNNNTAGVIHVT
jgi:hypothetical protein